MEREHKKLFSIKASLRPGNGDARVKLMSLLLYSPGVAITDDIL
jgi:hypothetical protein